MLEPMVSPWIALGLLGAFPTWDKASSASLSHQTRMGMVTWVERCVTLREVLAAIIPVRSPILSSLKPLLTL